MGNVTLENKGIDMNALFVINKTLYSSVYEGRAALTLARFMGLSFVDLYKD